MDSSLTVNMSHRLISELLEMENSGSSSTPELEPPNNVSLAPIHYQNPIGTLAAVNIIAEFFFPRFDQVLTFLVRTEGLTLIVMVHYCYYIVIA